MLHLSAVLEKNHHVCLHTLSYTPDVYDISLNSRVYSYSRNKALKYFYLLQVAYRIRKSDVIVIWNSPMQFVWWISKKIFFSRARLIWWQHHIPWYYSDNANFVLCWKQYLEKQVVKDIDTLLCSSQYLMWKVNDIYGIKSQLLYPVLDRAVLQSPAISKTSVLFTYGRWVPGKNIEQVFQTYDALKWKISDLELWIWWEWNELDQYASVYSWDRNVKILWRLSSDQITSYGSKASVFLFPSQIDAFGMVVIEAFALWLPVVCFDTHSAPELVQNDYNGYRVTSRSDFIDKVDILLTNQEQRLSLSLWALKTAPQFSASYFEQCVSKIIVS